MFGGKLEESARADEPDFGHGNGAQVKKLHKLGGRDTKGIKKKTPNMDLSSPPMQHQSLRTCEPADLHSAH